MADNDTQKSIQKALPDAREQANNVRAGIKEASGISDNKSGSTVLNQARKFLESDDVRDASEERKRAFLEKKGLENDEIQALLKEVQDATNLGSESDSTKGSKSSPPPLPSTPPPTSLTTRDNHETPPIVTYPEFLTRRRAPPPLITAQGVLNALYVAAGASTTIYAGSKYLVTPMTNQLTEARHSLAEVAMSRLALLNEKLESAVSEIPIPRRSTATEQDHLGTSATSSDSDPTELFHVDIGTQTSPFQSRRPSTSSASSDQVPDKVKSLSDQITAVSDLQDHIEELMVESNLDREQGSAQLQTSLSELTKYLEGFSYSSPYYTNNATSGAGLPKFKASAKSDSDAINQVKSEIRSIKGVFLNARNFPSGGGAIRGALRTGV